MHLLENNIQELAYAYVRGEELTDRQAGYKRHMADCDSCYRRFLLEEALQNALLSSGLIQDEVIQEILCGEDYASGKILFRMEKAADGFRMLVEKIKGRADSLWDFYPAPQMAFSRGDKAERGAAIYENASSEYSMIQIDEQGLLIRLDEEDYQGDRLSLKVVRGDGDSIMPFTYNEEEGSFDVFVSGRIEPGTRFEILEVSDED